MSELSKLLDRAFENKSGKNHYRSGAYSIGFEDRPFETLFEVYFNNVPVLSGNTFTKSIELCATEDVHPYEKLFQAVSEALPEYKFWGEVYCNFLVSHAPEGTALFAEYFCGEYNNAVITADVLWDKMVSGELEQDDTLNYLQIFDRHIYPSLSDAHFAREPGVEKEKEFQFPGRIFDRYYVDYLNDKSLKHIQTIESAIVAARRDDYDQFIYVDSNGDYSFCRSSDNKPAVPIFDDEKIIGKTVTKHWPGGPVVKYEEYPKPMTLGQLEAMSLNVKPSLNAQISGASNRVQTQEVGTKEKDLSR